MNGKGSKVYLSVRTSLIQQGSSLNQWAAENGVFRQYLTKLLKEETNGPAAQKVRAKILSHMGMT